MTLGARIIKEIPVDFVRFHLKEKEFSEQELADASGISLQVLQKFLDSDFVNMKLVSDGLTKLIDDGTEWEVVR